MNLEHNGEVIHSPDDRELNNTRNIHANKVESRSVPDISSRLQKLNMKLDYLPNPSKSERPRPDLPSPFSEPAALPRATKANIKDTQGRKLKLQTTPDALYDRESYMGTRNGTASAHPGTTKGLFNPEVHSPPKSANPANAKSAVGGQAADMHARILALQRSRSKKPANSPSSTQVSPHNSISGGSSGANCGSSAGANGSNGSNGSNGPDRMHFSSVPNGALMNTHSRPSSRLNTPDSIEMGLFKDNYSPTIEEGTQSPRLPPASNGFDPNTVISPTAASLAASGGAISVSRTPSFRTKQRSSLSARRGMNLDGSLLQKETNANNPDQSAPPQQQKLKAKGVKFQEPSNETAKGSFFKDCGKYIDIETGSLNFAGKACVHAHGIDFTSGEKFNISLDKLKFISELGSGNYGTVQKVLHTPNNVLMAVKEIRLELDESSLRQIIMELDVLHRCDMKNIIAFYGAFFVEGSVYICMEYMDGGSINKIYDGGIPEKYLRYVVQSIVKGLKRLKEEFNIIHRDVKPSNVLCSTNGSVKLCDFGVSGNLVASIAKTNIGCQSYMAPERIKVGNASPNQQMTYTAESDIWSLGLSIIEMARGSYPYPSDSFQSIFSQLNAIVEDPSPKLDPTRYSPEACDFVSRLLDKSPVTRPRYPEIVEHPWLKINDCSEEEMGEFVKSRLETLAQLEGEREAERAERSESGSNI